MAYNSAHTGPEIDAAVEMLGQVQDARDATSGDRSAVVTLASQVAVNASQVASQAATVSAKTGQVLASATAVEQAHAEVISAGTATVESKDAAALSAGAAQASQDSAAASEFAASQSQLAAGLSEQISAENAAFTSADRLHVDALARQVEADSAASQASADSAALSALNAAAVVTGGTAAISSSPGKIPLADAQGKIDSGWIGTDIARADAMQSATEAIAEIKDEIQSLPTGPGVTATAHQATSTHNADPDAHPELTAFIASAADRAETAADAAQLSAGIFPTTAAGLAAAASPGYFSVPSADSNEYLILYQNVAGVATEKSRYPSKVAVDNVLGLISPSASSPVVASIADVDGFELLQLSADGFLGTPGFTIKDVGFASTLLSVQTTSQAGILADLSIMDSEGFHYPLDPVAAGVAQATAVSALRALRESLANEFEDVYLRLVGDSITWGVSATGNSTSDPRAHALSDVRNNLTAPTWANLLHRYLGARYSSGVLSNPAPGAALYEAVHVVDVVASAKVSMINVATREVAVKPATADVSSALEVRCVVPNAYALRFDTVGTGFSVIYTEMPAGGTFQVVVDGIVNSTVVTANAATTYGKSVAIALPFGKHAIELRCTGAVSFEAIQRTRRIRVANDGLIGTATHEWLPTGSLLPASVASDDTHVFVQLGTNDRSMATEPTDPVRTKRNLSAIAEYLTKTRGKVLVLMSANYADTDFPSASTYKYSQADVARMTAQVAASVGCGYVDNYRATLKQKVAGEPFLADGLHPNDAGHLQMFKNIVDSLEQA